MNLSILRLPHGRDLPLPSYATDGSAGLDLLAAIEGDIEIKSRRARRDPLRNRGCVLRQI